MTSPKIYSESEMQEAIETALREERAKVAFRALPLALQVFPRDAPYDGDYWEPMPARKKGLTLPAGEYYIGDVGAELPEEENERDDGFYSCGKQIYGKFTTLNGAHAVGDKTVWVDYESFGIMPAETMKEEGGGNWRNGYVMEIDREFCAGFDATTRTFWVEVPGNAAASFRVKMCSE